MSTPQIDAYRFGHIVIDGASHDADVIVFPDRVRGNWWRREGHSLHVEDLQEVLSAKPDTLVVGQGAYGRMRVPDETRRVVEAAGITLIAARTEDACKQYNEMREHGRVVAALHLTC